MNKPPVLSDEELYRKVFCNIPQLKAGDDLTPLGNKIAQAQRDADYEHQQKVIREIFEGLESDALHYKLGLMFPYDEWQSLKDKFLKKV